MSEWLLLSKRYWYFDAKLKISQVVDRIAVCREFDRYMYEIVRTARKVKSNRRMKLCRHSRELSPRCNLTGDVPEGGVLSLSHSSFFVFLFAPLGTTKFNLGVHLHHTDLRRHSARRPSYLYLFCPFDILHSPESMLEIEMYEQFLCRLLKNHWMPF